MIGNNQKKVGDNKIKGTPGGNANESRFFSTERELRKHKVMIVPSVNTNGIVKMEQGWCRKAREKDVVRLTIGKCTAIVTREELEQAMATLAQGFETLKYQSSTIAGNGNNYLKKHLN